MNFRPTLRQIFTATAGVVLIPFFQAPAAKLAEKTHFDAILADHLDPVINWLSIAAHNLYYVFGAGVLLGIAAGMWLPKFVERRSHATSIDSIERVSQLPGRPVHTQLRIEFMGGKQVPRLVSSQNILTWYYTVAGNSSHNQGQDILW